MSAVDTQKRLEDAVARRDVVELCNLIAVECIVAPDEPNGTGELRGRDAILVNLARRSGDGWMFRMTFTTHHELGGGAVLVTGAVRRRVERGGHVISSAAWVNEFVDGLLVASRTYPCETVARAAYLGWASGTDV